MNDFKSQWSRYVSLYWERFYSKFKNRHELFPKESILLWGCVSYTEYENSHLFYSNPIQVDRKDLNVYYYLRKISEDKMKIITFMNVVGVRDQVEMSNDPDYLLLRELYRNNICIHSAFEHEYSKNCWETLLNKELFG
jgi:hypothetical protein